MNILFVDDDQEDIELFMELVCEMMPEATCRSLISCQEITNDLDRFGHPDVIFLDAHMFPISGKDCVIMMKGIIDPQKTRVIILTGTVSKVDEDEFLALGVAAVIWKGTTVQEIKSTLHRAIHGN